MHLQELKALALATLKPQKNLYKKHKKTSSKKIYPEEIKDEKFEADFSSTISKSIDPLGERTMDGTNHEINQEYPAEYKDEHRSRFR